jgi:TRAP-type C4-dicarboxylate transport system permease small subunit
LKSLYQPTKASVRRQNRLENSIKNSPIDDKNKEKNKQNGIVNKVFQGSMIVFLSLMVILVFINAVMRYVFKDSLPVSEEYARFFFMWSVFLGTVAAFKDKAHVAVTVLTDNLHGKAKMFIYVLAQAISLLVMVLLMAGGYTYTMSAATYKSVATGINYGLVVSGFLIMVIGTAIIIVKDTLTELKKMSKGE